MTVYGADVASYQSEEFSTAGLDFVFVKATEGTTYVSAKMNAQAAHARATKCVVGFYHFLRHGDMQKQAQYFVDKCASVEGDILAADWEDSDVTSAQKDQFIHAVQKLRPGHKVVLYCNRDYWLNRDKSSFCGDGLWIADPGHAAGKPAVEHAWTFHQYSITGGMDRNVGNFKNYAALKAWALSTEDVDDVALSDADIDKIVAKLKPALLDYFASKDGVWFAPQDAADYDPNPDKPGHYWAWKTHVNDNTSRIRKLTARVEDIAKKLGA